MFIRLDGAGRDGDVVEGAVEAWLAAEEVAVGFDTATTAYGEFADERARAVFDEALEDFFDLLNALEGVHALGAEFNFARSLDAAKEEDGHDGIFCG